MIGHLSSCDIFSMGCNKSGLLDGFSHIEWSLSVSIGCSYYPLVEITPQGGFWSVESYKTPNQTKTGPHLPGTQR